MWLIVEAWGCEMGNVCRNPCCSNLQFFSESISVYLTDEIQRGTAALLPTWPLGLSCVELTAGSWTGRGDWLRAVKQPLGPVWWAVVGRAITLPSNKDSSDVEIGRESEFVTCNLLLSP